MRLRPITNLMSMIYSSTMDQDFEIVPCLPSSRSTRSTIRKHSWTAQLHVRQSSRHNKSYMSQLAPLDVTLKASCRRTSRAFNTFLSTHHVLTWLFWRIVWAWQQDGRLILPGSRTLIDVLASRPSERSVPSAVPCPERLIPAAFTTIFLLLAQAQLWRFHWPQPNGVERQRHVNTCSLMWKRARTQPGNRSRIFIVAWRGCPKLSTCSFSTGSWRSALWSGTTRTSAPASSASAVPRWCDRSSKGWADNPAWTSKVISPSSFPGVRKSDLLSTVCS